MSVILHWFLPTNGDSLEVFPNLWAGVGLVRGGAGTALVGSYEEVADRIAEYHDLGIDEPGRLSDWYFSNLASSDGVREQLDDLRRIAGEARRPDGPRFGIGDGLEPAAAPDPGTGLSEIDPALPVAG